LSTHTYLEIKFLQFFSDEKFLKQQFNKIIKMKMTKKSRWSIALFIIGLVLILIGLALYIVGNGAIKNKIINVNNIQKFFTNYYDI
jgi:hypothetical protein